MRYFSFVCLCLFTLASYGVAPTEFDIKGFFTDAKFIGTGIVISGISIPEKTPKSTCGATFKVLVESPILGAKQGEIIEIHHLMDSRFPSLEIGSRYFIYAEDKSTHKFINLGDMIDSSLNDSKPKSCHSQTTSLYIYREFTQKISSEDGFNWIGEFSLGSWTGLQQIKQTKSLPWVYSGIRGSKFGMFTESWDYWLGKENVFGGALQLEPVIKLFKEQVEKKP